jgi:hypothetical protein
LRSRDDRTLNRILIGVAVSSACAALACWLLHPLSTAPGTSLYDSATFEGAHLGQPDVTLNAWILAWGSHALATGRVSDFFDANIFYPEPATLAYSEHLLGVLPIFAPLYWTTGNLALSLNLWTVGTFVFCALAMYWVGLRWFESHAAAAVAAIAYAFAPARFHALTHVQALSVQYLPLLAYAIWATSHRRDAATWLAIAVLAGVQALSSYYLGYAGFVVAGAMAVCALFGATQERTRRALFIGSALLAAALLMVPVSLPYLELRSQGQIGDARVILEPWGYLRAQLFPDIPAPGPASWAAWRVIPVLATAGALLGLATARYRALTAAFGLLLLLGCLLAMGPFASLLGVKISGLHDLAARVVPGWSTLRIYGRFSIAAWLALSLLAALPFARGVRWLGPHRTPLAIVALLLVASLAWSASRIAIRTLVPPDAARSLTAYRWLAERDDGDPVLEWPMQFGKVDSDYMYLSTLHWRPLVNGYSGHRPPSNELLASLAACLPEPVAARSLVQLNVARWLVVHMRRPGWGVRTWQRLAEVGAELRFTDDDLRIYELPFEKSEPSPLRRQTHDDRTLFGTSKSPLRFRDLEAEIVPLLSEIDSLGGNEWVELRVRNASPVSWPALAAERDGLVGLTFRSRRLGEERYRPLRGFARLPADLAPGQSATLQARLYPPRERGDYELLPCLQQWGRKAWRCFDAARMTLRVRPPLPTPDEASRPRQETE